MEDNQHQDWEIISTAQSKKLIVIKPHWYLYKQDDRLANYHNGPINIGLC